MASHKNWRSSILDYILIRYAVHISKTASVLEWLTLCDFNANWEYLPHFIAIDHLVRTSKCSAEQSTDLWELEEAL